MSLRNSVAVAMVLSFTTALASDPTRQSKVTRPAFDSENAWKQLIKQCDFGPRPVGSEAHNKTRDYLVSEMKKYADKTISQDFKYKDQNLTNVIGVFNPEAKKTILLCAHWDTRPRAEEDPDPAKRQQPIIGANDGASGVAILLELAREFKEKKPSIGVVIALWDGEDYGDFDKDEGVLLGARYFAKNKAGLDPDYGILIDMVGDKDLNIYREINSQRYAPGTNNRVFTTARELGYGRYLIDRIKQEITDDHLPLNQARIPTIDLIDFDYPSWHTTADTPDKCSKLSLNIVGNVLAEVVYRDQP